MTILLAAWAALRRVPLWVWVLVALLAAGAWYGHTQRLAGRAEVQAQWDASVRRGEYAVAKLKYQASQVTEKVVTEYVTKDRIVKEKGDEIVRQVPVYVPVGSCALPGGFRLLHDAAVSGSDLPGPAGIADAAAVPAQDAAATVADNYTTCRRTAAQLTALQEWVAGQAALVK